MGRLGHALTAEVVKEEAALSVVANRLLIFTGCRKSEILTLQ